MSCDICGRSSCCNSFHSLEEQEKYSKAIEAFDRAREIRAAIHDAIQEEAEDIKAEREVESNPPAP